MLTEEIALFSSAFLAATILPFSSEAALLLALENGMLASKALLFATSGNILAIIFNYLLGFFIYEKSKTKLKSSKIGRRALLYGHKHGYYALVFSWMPVIGDPITIVAGLVRMNFVYFVMIAGVLRFVRYYLLTFVI